MSSTFQLPESAASLNGSRCLVTGGAGFIGSHVVDAILDQGASVRVLDNFSTGFKTNLQHRAADAPVEVIDGDAACADTVDQAARGCDTIFHLAAMASVPRSMREPQLCHAWCATSTVNLLAAAEKHNVRRMVLASTSAIYGNSTWVSKRESDPPAPLSPYAAAKLSAESYLQSFARTTDVETVILRYFNVYGPRQDPKSEYSAVIPRFVSMILTGERPIIYGDGEQSRDFVYVGDVARANLLAATVPNLSGRTFNIACGRRTTLLELLVTLREILGQEIEPIHEPPRIGDVKDSLADITEARTKLLFEPAVTIGDGLRDSVEYYRSLCSPT
ncbi:NAD-dependent epimerase/dehydratase family protein [Roseiconus lacunae]|uniref:NAD-dependent epimerase/dehydratase family protein n=1 Tax=Roseiconus lacunae TaxID=2605694 RepID=UPI001E4ED12E|nr:NAD-dependent epimerase/dehydratase family protein [Roseiconus lacunae]MCD0461697.1 NAD-dependent epimerase/dehydratase family protein [Roseiconus lacunae]